VSRGETNDRTLVLGATSLVGRCLMPRLEGRIAALSREPRMSARVHWLLGDVGDPDVALPPARTVFSLMPLWLLPEALPRLSGVERLVAFSSTSRFTKADSPEPYERDVARRLAEAEEAMIRFCEAAGIGWTILRPTLIYSEGVDQNVSRLAGLIGKLGFLPLAGKGEGRRQPVHAEDLAAGAIAAAGSTAARNRAYDLPGGETLTYRTMAERVFEGMGRRARIVPIPLAAWKLAFALASPLLPGATASMGSRMSEDLVFDPGPAARDFDWAPRDFRPKF
jgi:nucleoside-diphosphate-sugar epimerase